MHLNKVHIVYILWPMLCLGVWLWEKKIIKWRSCIVLFKAALLKTRDTARTPE